MHSQADTIAYGLWHTEATHSAIHPDAAPLRDLTLSWLRFGYQGPVMESPAIETILQQALMAPCCNGKPQVALVPANLVQKPKKIQ